MIDFNISEIAPLCKEFGVDLTEDIKNKLNLYGNLLLEWNEKINLTAIKEPTEVLYKHFYDCILFFKNVEVKNGATLIDVGTGAGFPGMVLKIVRPDLKVTLLDSLNKRINFLNDVIAKLDLKDLPQYIPVRRREVKTKHTVNSMILPVPVRWRHCRLCLNTAPRMLRWEVCSFL